MDFSQISLTVSAAGLVAVVGFLIKGSMRLGALEVKVETMWSFQMRRAVSETLATGLGQMHSPLVFTDAAREALAPIAPALEAFWHTLPHRINDADALLAIEAAFGDALLQQVCVPCSLSHGACLLLALAIAKGSSELNLAARPPLPLARLRGWLGWSG